METKLENKPLVLLVEDNPTNLAIMRALLNKQDCIVIEATTGRDALRAIEKHTFALILLDIQLPDIDGFEVAEILSHDSRKRETPLIFISDVFTDETSRLNSYKFGAVDFLVKPVDNFIFQSKIKVFLDLHHARLSQMQLLKLVHKRNDQLEIEVNERKKAEESARHQASHDPLTDLPNRMLFMDRLETAISRAKREKGRMGLLYIDIDRFKPVNDTYGHHAGDELLISIAQRLRENLREADTIARLGGDEFAVVLENIQDENTAHQVVDKLTQALNTEFIIRPTENESEITVNIGGSMGLAIYPDDADEEEALLRIADQRMYENKKE